MAYTPTTWQTGDTITAEKMNKLESGVTDNSLKTPTVTFSDSVVVFDTTTVQFAKDGDNDWYITAENPISGFTSADFLYDCVYTVEWDGVEYETFARMYHKQIEASGWHDWGGIGNVVPIGYTNVANDSSLPFLIEFDFKRNAGEVQIISYDSNSSHSVKLSKKTFVKSSSDPVIWESSLYYGMPTFRFGQNSAVLGAGALSATGELSCAEGACTVASGDASHAEGSNTIASGWSSHAEGIRSVASEKFAHAEGNATTASGERSHAEGIGSVSSGRTSHAEGQDTVASGAYAHADGKETVASGNGSRAAGVGTIANHLAQHVFGRFNVADTSSAAVSAIGNYVEIVGNGTAANARSNARTLDWEGNESLAGGITLGKGTADEVTVTPVQMKALIALLNG